MKKRVFFTSLISVLIIGVISLIIVLSYFKDNTSYTFNYSGVASDNVSSSDFSLDGYNCCEIESRNFKSYDYSGSATISQIDENYIVKSELLNNSLVNIGDFVKIGDILGSKKTDGSNYSSVSNGVVLLVENLENGIQITYSNVDYLGFVLTLSSNTISYITYNLAVDVYIPAQDKSVSAYVSNIDYSNNVTATFKFRDLNGDEFLPNCKIDFFFVKQEIGKHFCVPLSFFEQSSFYYSLGSHSLNFEVYYFDENNSVKKTMFSTGIINNKYIQIKGENIIREGLKVYRKNI